MITFYARTDGAGQVRPLKRRFPDLELAYDYAAALTAGTALEADAAVAKHPELVLKASTDVEHALSGAHWPVRVFEVSGDPVGELARGRDFHRLIVHRELSHEEMFGPQGPLVAALLDKVVALKDDPAELTAVIEELGSDWRHRYPGANPNHGLKVDFLRDVPPERLIASGVAWMTLLGIFTATKAEHRAEASRAVIDAVDALANRDLVGDQWSWSVYEEITDPVREVFGALRPQVVPGVR